MSLTAWQRIRTKSCDDESALWMAAAVQGFWGAFVRVVGCGHVSGLAEATVTAAGLDEFRGSDPLY